MICGGHHVFVAINMAFTTCGESHQQEWPAYIKGLGGYKNQYTRHSIMSKIILMMIILQSVLQHLTFDVEICPSKKPILAGGTFTAVGLCGLFSFASDKPGQAKSNQCISKLMHRGNVPEGRSKKKVLLG